MDSHNHLRVKAKVLRLTKGYLHDLAPFTFLFIIIIIIILLTHSILWYIELLAVPTEQKKSIKYKSDL